MNASETGWVKKVLLGLGMASVIAGLIRQWPVLGKSYSEFIAGDGYLCLTLGLILTVLGYSAHLLVGAEED